MTSRRQSSSGAGPPQVLEVLSEKLSMFSECRAAEVWWSKRHHVVLIKGKIILLMCTEDNGYKLDCGQSLKTNWESASQMSVIRQQGPSHEAESQSQDSRPKKAWQEPGRIPGVQGLASAQGNKTWMWMRGWESLELELRVEITSRERGQIGLHPPVCQFSDTNWLSYNSTQFCH